MVGTPDFCKELSPALAEPLEYDNVMYSCHFYAGTHYDELREELDRAVSAGLPVFITECGISGAYIDGKEEGPDYENSRKWFTYMKKHDIGFAVWSLANKDEPSSMVQPLVTDFVPLGGKKLTGTGLWVRELVRGTDPEIIPDPDKADLTFQDKNPVSSMIYRAYLKLLEAVNI
jgi:cellulose synthase (UDP-forming)